MTAFHIKTIVPPNGKLTIDLPFRPGEEVEIDVQSAVSAEPQPTYPLRGCVIEYSDPTEPVAVDDWEVLQ